MAKTPRIAASTGPGPDEVARVWANGKIPRVALIMGPESALREEALRGIKTAAYGKGDGGMNWILFHGPDSATQGDPVEPATILDEVCTLSMFAAEDEPKVVVLRKADHLLNLARTREIFERNLDIVPASASLILEVTEPGRFKATGFYKKLANAGAVISCDVLHDPWGSDGPDSPLGQILAKRASALGLKLDTAAAAALMDRSGHTLGVLEEELGKLSLSLGGSEGTKIVVDKSAIERICSETRLADPFEFADALSHRDARRGMEILGTIFSHGLGDYKKPGRVVTQEAEIAMRLLGVLTWKLTQLQDVQAGMEAGQPAFEVFKQFKVFGPAQNSMRIALAKHTTAIMRNTMAALLQANLSIRTGNQPRPVLEKLMWDVCKGKITSMPLG